ncbi:MAG TPA: histidinol-phosphate transaminase [Trueperaceae bacterium]
MSIRPRIRELAAYDFAPHPEGVKLDQNELPYDLPELLRQELLARIAALPLNRYPDLDASELRAALARLHDWPADGIVVTPGSNVLIQNLVIAAGIGQTVLLPTPTFSVYRMQASILGAELVEVPSGPAFRLPVADLLREMEGRRGLLFVANPAAPTGNLHDSDDLERLADAAGDRWLVVIDEAYGQFAGSDSSQLARRPGVLSLRTLSKAFGLAGARVGYALTSPQLAGELRKVVLPFVVSGLQQAAALTMIEHNAEVEERARQVALERAWLQRSLNDVAGVHVFPSTTNFVLFRVDDGRSVYEGLLGKGVVVRPQSGPGLENCLRVTAGTREENERFLEALRATLVEVEHA